MNVFLRPPDTGEKINRRPCSGFVSGRALFRILGCFLTVSVVWANTAGAREENRSAEAQYFKPAMDHLGIFTVESAQLVDRFQWGFKSTLHFADEPMSLNFRNAPEGGSIAAVDYALGVHLQTYLGLLSFLQLNLDFSFYRQWLGEAFDVENPDGFSANDPDSLLRRRAPAVVAGDVRLGLKFGLFNWRGLRLAALLIGVVPLGDETVFAGEKSWAGEGKIAISYSRGPLMVAANAGYLIRKEQNILDPVAWRRMGERRVMLELDDELTWGAGAKYAVTNRVGFGLEAHGRVPLMIQETADMPMEVLGGVLLKITGNTFAAVGGGAGIGRYLTHDGIKPLGRSNMWRVFATLTFSPTPKKVVPVEEVEEEIKWADRDGDGVPDHLDKCPDEPGPPENYGCPWPDRDGDGVPDHLDKCPDEPGPPENYGCPWPDRDGDGVPDHLDKCPDEPGPPENYGCPWPEDPTDPQITDEKIELKEQIFFATAKAEIIPESTKELDKLAELLIRNPQIQLVRIEGHTDSRGRAKTNLKLSQARAEAVMDYLVSKGVAPQRLQAVGYGDKRPIETNETKEGRAANRRVEFIIVRQ